MGVVGEVDDVALLEEVGRPALTAVWGVEPVLGLGSVDLALWTQMGRLTVAVCARPWMKTRGCWCLTSRGVSFSTYICPCMYWAEGVPLWAMCQSIDNKYVGWAAHN